MTIKSELVGQIVAEMRNKGLSKTAMSVKIGTTRTQFDRLLDPACVTTTLETVEQAAKALGRSAKIVLD